MEANMIGSLSTFHPEEEEIEEYLERVQLHFDTNGIKNDKQVAVLLKVISSGSAGTDIQFSWWAMLGGWGSSKEVRFVDIFDSGQLGSILETPC